MVPWTVLLLRRVKNENGQKKRKKKLVKSKNLLHNRERFMWYKMHVSFSVKLKQKCTKNYVKLVLEQKILKQVEDESARRMGQFLQTL